jgi:tRNA A-37 threonylcarbamoyl transferase component Bud32
MKRNGLLVVMTEKLQVYKASSKSYHSIVGDMYVKKLSWKISNDWFEKYKDIRAYEPRIIEIYNIVDNDTIYMKNLNGKNLDEFITEDYYSQYLNIANNIYKYNKDKKIKFYHRDMQFQNFVADKGVVYLIDPDSFRFIQ